MATMTDPPPREPVHVAVAGLIGAGKSTFVRNVAPLLGFTAAVEAFEANPYLSRFYDNPTRWGFRNFLWFYGESVRVQAAARRYGPTLQERTVHEHFEVFGREFRSRCYITQEDFQLMRSLVEAVSTLLPPPNLLVFLDVDPNEAKRRVLARNRQIEGSLGNAYLNELHGRYLKFVEGWAYGPVLRLDTHRMDVRQPSGAQQAAREVLAALPTST